jgi:hypothetical protein
MTDPVFTPEYVFLSILLIVAFAGLAMTIGLFIGTIISNLRKK